eukprot:COSAG04_NODE_14256_length_575_cov_1.176471_1_plen_34_part_10
MVASAASAERRREARLGGLAMRGSELEPEPEPEP